MADWDSKLDVAYKRVPLFRMMAKHDACSLTIVYGSFTCMNHQLVMSCAENLPFFFLF